jgi:hypothetical protein
VVRVEVNLVLVSGSVILLEVGRVGRTLVPEQSEAIYENEGLSTKSESDMSSIRVVPRKVRYGTDWGCRRPYMLRAESKSNFNAGAIHIP